MNTNITDEYKSSTSSLNSTDINIQLTSKYLTNNKHSAIRMILVYFRLVAFMPCNVFILSHPLPVVHKEGKPLFYSTINWNMYHRFNINSNGRGSKAAQKHQHQMLLEESKKYLRERNRVSFTPAPVGHGLKKRCIWVTCSSFVTS